MILGWDGMRRALATATVAVVASLAATAPAQTPVASCGADSLYLFSPAAIGLKLNASGRRGLTVELAGSRSGTGHLFRPDRYGRISGSR